MSAAPWVASLLRWFVRHRRAMPWRERPTPYAVWVSEVMLQQTQVNTVIPYFRRFLRAFPSVRALARADLQRVLKQWEGLGYYTRARNMHRAAQAIVSEHAGQIPRTAAALQSLPGIGEYTAAAVASICFGEPVPVVDGNVLRVFARFWGIRRDIRDRAVRREVATRLQPAMPVGQAGTFNQAVMEVGALVCRPRSPDCPDCPLRPKCVALKRGLTGRLPVRSGRPPVPHYDVTAAVIRRRGRVLITRRRADRMLGGMWEFPGGKRHPGETLEEALRREIEEETSLQIEVGPPLCSVDHAYSHFRMTLHAFECRPVRGRARPLDSDGVKWVPLSRLRDYPFPAADRRIIATLMAARSEA